MDDTSSNTAPEVVVRKRKLSVRVEQNRAGFSSPTPPFSDDDGGDDFESWSFELESADVTETIPPVDRTLTQEEDDDSSWFGFEPKKKAAAAPVPSLPPLHGHEVVDLSGLSNIDDDGWSQNDTDTDAINEALSRNLMAKGWCFVRLPSHMVLTSEHAAKLRTFFEANDASTKASFAERQGYGYSAVADHKEAYRLLTGERLLKHRPRELTDEWFARFVRDFDTSILHLMLQMAKPVFGKYAAEVARIAELPVGYEHGDHFGMLDFARYRNTRVLAEPVAGDGASSEEVNCVPHYDPGLLSISFYSDRQGLQLKAPQTRDEIMRSEQWVDGPVNTVAGQEDLGVLWLGEAAVRVNDKLKAGIHRVVYPSPSGEENRARLTGWYEVCTTDQALGPNNDDKQFEENSKVAIPNIISPKIKRGRMVLVPMRAGETRRDFLAKVERTYGIPPSKTIHLSDSFKTDDYDYDGDNSS